MTYEELAEKIWSMTDEQRRMTVTIYVRGVDEFYGVTEELKIVGPADDDLGSGVLDESHPYLVI